VTVTAPWINRLGCQSRAGYDGLTIATTPEAVNVNVESARIGRERFLANVNEADAGSVFLAERRFDVVIAPPFATADPYTDSPPSGGLNFELHS